MTAHVSDLIAPLDYLQWIADKSDMGEDVKFSARYWIRKRTKA
jgi:exodeoxyribonuclease X